MGLELEELYGSIPEVMQMARQRSNVSYVLKGKKKANLFNLKFYTQQKYLAKDKGEIKTFQT